MEKVVDAIKLYKIGRIYYIKKTETPTLKKRGVIRY